MRKLLIFSLVSIGVVGALALWARHVLHGIEERGQALVAEYEERVAALNALDERFPPPPPGRLDAERFAKFVRVRAGVARLMRSRFAEEKKTAFHARETRNLVLQHLHAQLVEETMGLGEYRAVAARFRALLAADARLKERWTVDTKSGHPPRPLPLPDPAPDATPAERALIEQHRDSLTESMPAGLLQPLLAVPVK